MKVVELETVDHLGGVEMVTLRLGEPSVAAVDLVDGEALFKAREVDYLECLMVVRGHLEGQGRLLCCQGARPEVWPSGQLRDWTNGLQAYVLDPARRGGEGFEVVDVFAPAPAGAVVSMADQRQAVLAFHKLSRGR